jgi:hypothetical protein
MKTVFGSALTETWLVTKMRDQIGIIRREFDYKLGERWFRCVQNRSGGSLAADTLVMYDGTMTTAVANTGTGTTYATRASGSWITDKALPGDIVHVVDDAGAAGAAPEGETSYLTKVAALRIDFLPALTVALANADTVGIIKPFSIIAAAAKAGKRVAGVPMADIADGYCGWVQCRGIHMKANVFAAGTALAEGDRLAAGAALLALMATVANNASTTDDINEVAVATALQNLASDTVRRKAVVMLDCQ